MNIPRALSTSIATILFGSAVAHATDYHWNTTTGDWNTPASWDLGVVPAGGGNNFAYISNGGTATITADTPSIQDVFVGRGAGNSGTINQTAGKHANVGWVFIGDQGGTGAWNVTGGGSLSTGRIYVGGTRDTAGGGNGSMLIDTTGTVTLTSDYDIGSSGGTGAVTMNSGTLNANSWFILGETEGGRGGGSGTFTQNGGTVNDGSYAPGGDGNGRIWIGHNEGNSAGAASTGTYNMNGGALNTPQLVVGTEYTGNFNQTNGTVTANLFYVGYEGAAVGTYNMNGGTLNTLGSGGETRIGGFNPGQTTASGTFNLSAGTVNDHSNFQVGAYGTGVLVMTGGTFNTSGYFDIGRFSGGNGTVTITGGNYIHNNTATSSIVGEQGVGVLNIAGNGNFAAETLAIGLTTTGNGTVNLTGGTLGANVIRMGPGTAKLNLDGGTLQATADSTDFIPGGTSTNIEIKAGGLRFDSNGHSVNIPESLNSPNFVAGVTKVGNGTLTLSGINGYSGTTVVNAGTLVVTGTNSFASGATIGSGGTLAFGSNTTSGMIDGTIAVAGALNFERSDDFTYAGTLTGSGTVNKNRVNTLTMAATTTGFNGTLNVNAGALVLNSAQGGTVAVNSGGRLVPVAGATGSVTVGSLSLNANSATDFEFGAGSNDTIVIGPGGTLSFGSSFTLNFYDVGATSAFATNGTYTLFDYDTTFTGNLSNLTVGNPVPGKGYALANNAAGTVITLTIVDSVLTAWNNSGGGLWTTPGNWTTLVPNVATADVTFGAAITAPATIDINGNKTVGKLTFDNVNTYTIGGTGALTLDNGATASTITVNTGGHIINTPIALAGNLSVNLASGTTLQLGDLTGPKNLTVSGSGSLTLSGAGNYNDTALNGGVLVVGAGGTTGSLGSGPVSLAPNTIISFNRSDAITVPNKISGDGALSQDSAGSILYTGTATYTGSTTLNGGTFINEGTINGTTSLDVENTTTLRAASSTTIAGPTAIANNGGVTAALNIQGSATASFGGPVSVASAFSSTGALNINTTGNVSVAGDLAVGQNGGSGDLQIGSGTVTQSGGGGVLIGRNGGSASFEMTGGTLNVGTNGLKFADGGGTNATGTMSGGTISTSGEVWASNNGGNATINISAGSISTSNWIAIGRLGGTGTVNLGGGSLNKTGGNGNHIIIGSLGGVGTLNQLDGSTLTSSSDVRIGENNGSVRSNGSLWNMNGGTATVNGTINVGWHSSTAEWDLLGGNVTAARLAIGSESVDAGAGPAVGTVTMSGGTLNLTSTAIESRIGGDTPTSADSQGTLNISGGTLTTASNFQIGAYGVGTLNMTGGSITASVWPVIGRFAGGNGTANISGGTFIHNNPGTALVVAEEGTGVLNISGTALVDVQSLRVGHAATGNGTVNLDGGTLATPIIQKTNASSTAQFNFNGGILKVTGDSTDFFTGFQNGSLNVAAGGANIDTNGHTISINPSLTGVGGVTKLGNGTLTLNGAQSYASLSTVAGTTNLMSSLPGATINNNGGTLNINANATGSTVNVHAVTNFGTSQSLVGLSIGAGGVATLAAHFGGTAGINAIDTSGLTITGNGKLDLTNNAMVVRGGSESAITAKVASGFDGGLWDGPGINSSTAAADPNFRTAVAVVSNADLGYTDFAGVTGLTGSEILLKYTYFGDSDLTGTVTSDDFGLFLDGYNHVTPAKWVNGDYDYSGTVTSDDFGLFLESFNNQGGALRDPGLAAQLDTFAQQMGAGGSGGSATTDLGSAGTVAAGQAVVPEPGSSVMLLAGAGALGLRRRRVARHA